MTRLFNLKSKKSLRIRLRQEMTKAEIVMWNMLRSGEMEYKFRRQHSIGPYIVDFYCPSLKLVIEIDGDIHVFDKNIKKDLVRQNYLENIGLRVVRYNNIEVLNNIESVFNDLFDKINNLTPALPLLRGGSGRG